MANKELPVFERQVSVHPTSTPDIQGAYEQFAASDNNLSAVGTNIAAKASNALAQQLGGDAGHNPHGNLFPSLTDFDKTFAESYKTQAHATLGLQAEKLITDTNLAVSSASRITPDLITKSQSSIAEGLQKIYAQAPSEIRPQLEATYNSAQLSQMEQLNKRMLSEQHEDRRNNTILSNDKNAELAHSLAASGNYAAAEQLIKVTESINNSAISANIGFTPQQGKVGADTVRQSYNAGRLQHGYDQANAQGKGEEYLKNLATRPDWIEDKDYPNAVQSIRGYVNNQQALKADYEQLTMSQFQQKIVTNAGGITNTELLSTLDKLSPINASKLNVAYVSGLKAQLKEKKDTQDLSNNWGDARAHANSDPKIINGTFNNKTAYTMRQDPTLSREAAENQVAAAAGGEIPVFTKTLKSSLWNGNAGTMISAARQIADLQDNGHGHALTGLSDQDLAIASDIKHNYNPADPESGARIIAENKENQDPKIRRSSEEAFENNIYTNTVKNGKQTDDYVLEKFGFQGGLFHAALDSPWSKHTYAQDILANWKTNFVNTRGDSVRTFELTQQYIKDNYGKTKINGASEWAQHPLEKACGFSEGDGLDSINEDIIRQISPKLEESKKAFFAEKPTSNEYWTIEKVQEKRSEFEEDFPISKTQPLTRLQFTKHERNGHAITTSTYPLRLVGNNFNWDLNVQSARGPRSIFLEAPQLGVHTYSPDVAWIKDHYDKGHL